ncbi:MAG: site-specific DNA-methyltransferase [Euzebyales bacterium]|nr:site-specific DNA-methyltransferase [Euzebyales bacterium]
MVYDPFGGTCTTAVAAEHAKRRWLVNELDPEYASVLAGRLVAGR